MVKFTTTDPEALLKRFWVLVKSTRVWWECEGRLTCTSPQWSRQAFLSPKLGDGCLEFHISNPGGMAVVYEAYRSRLIKFFANHLTEDFDLVIASSCPLPIDAWGKPDTSIEIRPTHTSEE